jgi:4-amino-4-deoxy-L-arabinose transferase-like glycosyltransferase
VGEARAVPWLPPRWLIGLIAALAALRLVFAALIGLTEDEAYYRLWALAPAASYLDHPPMVGWLIWLGRAIAGDNALGIRLLAVLLPIAGTLALWRTVALLFTTELATSAVLISLAMPLLAVGSMIITPDTPSVMFWGLAGWALAELAVSGRANWWLAVGIFAGLGLLSKYTNLFVGAGIVLWLVLLPANWRWFRSWQLWAAGALALLLASPVIWWNLEHGGASFIKQFGRVGAGHGLTLKYLGELLGAYAGLASPVIALLAMIGLGWTSRAAWRERAVGPTLLVLSVIPLLVYMLKHALHDRVQPNWLAPLYPAFAVFAALAAEQILREAQLRPRLARAVGWSLPVGFSISGLIFWHAMLPGIVLPGTKDPTSQTRGWAVLADEIAARAGEQGAGWIATSNFAATGELAFALAGRLEVLQLNERLRYIHLPPAAASLLAKPALYVELERNDQPQWLAARFRSITKLPPLIRSYRGVPLATYVLYRVADPIGPIFDASDLEALPSVPK